MTLNEAELRAKTDAEVYHWKEKCKSMERENKAIQRDLGSLKAYIRAVQDAVPQIAPEVQLYKPVRSKSKIPVVPVMHISDLHMGMVQEQDEIEGFGLYNPEIARHRMFKYAENFLKWLEKHRNAHVINEIAVVITGDNISGDIHHELSVTNAYPAPVQAVEAGKLLGEVIAILAPHGVKVTVHFIVEDNHGRLVAKPQSKEAGMNTHNYVVGEIATAYLREHKNVEFNSYPVYQKVINVNGRQYLACHGHGVKGWAGLPWYGLERKVAKESVKRMQRMMEAATHEDLMFAKKLGFHKYLFGHFHTPIDLPLYSGCGSVSGTDAYDHKNGRYSRPSQSSFLTHPENGEFDRTNWWLD